MEKDLNETKSCFMFSPFGTKNTQALVRSTLRSMTPVALFFLLFFVLSALELVSVVCVKDDLVFVICCQIWMSRKPSLRTSMLHYFESPLYGIGVHLFPILRTHLHTHTHTHKTRTHTPYTHFWVSLSPVIIVASKSFPP